jgi:hypothetical protein
MFDRQTLQSGSTGPSALWSQLTPSITVSLLKTVQTLPQNDRGRDN